MDKLLMGLSTTATGMLVVFSGLMILIGCIYVMTLFTARPKKKTPLPEPEVTSIEPVRSMLEKPSEEEDDQQVIAAIAAAVAMIWQGEEKAGGFVVRRVRRVSAGSARARAVREEQVYSRL